MADHVRQQVKDAALADLGALVTTGSNVFSSRVSPLDAAEMPGWYVMLRDEQAESDTIGHWSRAGSLVLEGWATGGDGLEDTLDKMASEAEAALYAANSAVQALCNNFGPPTTSLDLPQPDGDSQTRLGIVRIRFPLTYRTAIADPTAVV